jgi:hypothetical protein
MPIYAVLVARPLAVGHALWTQTEPSLTWLPFFLMRSLHFGQVPMGDSLDSFAGSMTTRPVLYTSRRAP